MLVANASQSLEALFQEKQTRPAISAVVLVMSNGFVSQIVSVAADLVGDGFAARYCEPSRSAPFVARVAICRYTTSFPFA